MQTDLEQAWRSFGRWLLGTALGGGAFLYALVLIIDPYDSVPFSPNWDRYPVTSQARPYTVKLARSGRFDSAVVGDSTAMLLKPQQLNRRFGGRFANLAMVGASPYEQLRLLRVLARTKAYGGTLIIGLGPFWCAPDGAPKRLPPLVGYNLFDWLYDENPWNDFPPLNQQTLQHARSQLKALIGWRVRYPKRPDGYRDFTQTYRGDKRLAAVRKRIYGEAPWLLERTQTQTPPRFPEIDALGQVLAQFPPETEKIAYFVPFHAHHQPAPGTEQAALWQACKEKTVHVLGELPRTHVLDFLIPSPITREDANYIDGQHHITAVAARLVDLLYAGAQHPERTAPEYRVLH